MSSTTQRLKDSPYRRRKSMLFAYPRNIKEIAVRLELKQCFSVRYRTHRSRSRRQERVFSIWRPITAVRGLDQALPPTP
jgi:hypothetical protein